MSTMGDRSWSYNHSRGGGRDNSRPRYSSSRNTTYYVNHGPPPVHYRNREPHHQQYNYTNPSPPRHFSTREPEPLFTRTIINSCYQPPPQDRFVDESPPKPKTESRHNNNSDFERSRHRSTSGSSSRHSNSSPNARFCEDRSPTRSQGRRSPSRSRESRSPTRYMNRSPPPSVSRVSAPVRPRTRTSPQRSCASPPIVPSRNKNLSMSYLQEQQRRERDAKTAQQSRPFSYRPAFCYRKRYEENEKPTTYSAEMMLLVERVKEYEHWLTSLRNNILEGGVDQEQEDDLDDIDWCLEVIQDINSSRNVSVQTLNRTQEIILELVTKCTIQAAPAGPPSGSVSEKNVPSPTVVEVDDSESARSPSPGLNSTAVRRKEELPPLNPRVIPTERAFRTDVNNPLDNKPNIPEPSEYVREQAQAREDQAYELMYERRKPPTVPEVKEITNSFQSPPKDFSELYQRRPNVPNLHQDKDMRTFDSSNVPQWDRSGGKDSRNLEGPPLQVQDQDMRIIEQSERSTVKTSQASEKLPQKVPAISNDTTSAGNMLGFSTNMMNPLNPASLNPPPTPQLPFLNQSLMNPFMNPSVIAGMSGMTGMTPQQILSMQSQAQIVLGFQQQMTNTRPGLLSTPSVKPNTSHSYGFQQPTQNPLIRPQAEQPKPPPQQVSHTPVVETPTAVPNTTNSEPTTEDMMSRIRAKAAQSFNYRGRGPPPPRYPPQQNHFGPRNGFIQSSSNQNFVRPSNHEINHEQAYHHVQGPSAPPPPALNQTNKVVVMDPRLKPRVPREPLQLPIAEVKPQEKVVVPPTEKVVVPEISYPCPVPPRIPNIRDRLRQSVEDSHPKDAVERMSVYSSSDSQGQKKNYGRWDRSERDSRTDYRRNSYGSSEKDRNSYNDTSNHERDKWNNQRDSRNNRYSRTSPKKVIEEKEKSNTFTCRDRSSPRSHPAVLPFEKAVFRNTSETGAGQAKFRIPKLKKPDPPRLPTPEPIPDPEEPQKSPGLDSTADIDSGIEVFDQSHKSDEDIPDSNPPADPVPTSREEKLSIEVEEPSNSSPSSPLVLPSPSSDKVKSLPREADSLIRSLLLESLNPEEAEILQTDEDYLASAIANLKAELSAKLKAKAKQISSGSALPHEEQDDGVNKSEPSGSDDRLRNPSGDSKEEEDKTDEVSRSRSSTRRKPNTKRRSSLEKLHDALREMNFDSMMPTGPRRSKIQTDEKPVEKPKESLKKVGEKAKTEVLKDKTPERVSTSRETPEPLEPLSEVIVRPKAKKRKSWKGTAGNKKRIRKASSSPLAKAPLAKAESTEELLSPPKPIKKKYQKKKFTKESPPAEISGREGVVTRSRRSDAKPSEPVQEPESTRTSAVQPPKAIELVSSTTEEPLDEVLNEDLMDLELSDLNEDLNPDMDFDMLINMNDEHHLPLQPEDFCIPDSDDETGFLISENGLEGLTVTQPELVEISDESGDELEKKAVKPVVVEESESVADSTVCHLCPYNGKRMIHHYANNHRGSSIPQARLSIPTYNSLVKLNTSQSPQLMEIPIKIDTAKKPICPCLFCDYSASGLNEYFEHLTTHTGEFRFGCTACKMRYPFRKSARSHLKSHKNKKPGEASIQMAYTRVITSEDWELYCYVCRECYYFQLEASNISNHLEESGHSEEDVICIKFQVLGVHHPAYVPSPVPSPPPPPPVKVPTYDPSVFIGTLSIDLEEEIGTSARSVSPLVPLDDQDDLESSIDNIYNRLRKAELTSGSDGGGNKSGENDAQIREGVHQVLTELVDQLSLTDELNSHFHSLSLVLNESALLWKKENTEDLLPAPSSELMDISMSVSEDGIKNDNGNVKASSTDTDDEEVEELNDYYFDTSSSDEEFCDYYESSSDEELKLVRSEHANGSSISPKSPAPQIELLHDDLNILISSPRSLHSEPAVSLETNEPEGLLNLEGLDLYRCAQDGCDYRFPTGAQLKDHLPFCGFLSDNQSNYACFHCDKRFKQIASLIEHLRVHGTPKQLCSLCSYRSCTSADLSRHMKCVHKVNYYKTVKSDKTIDSDVVMFPKDAVGRFTDPQLLQLNHMMYSPKVEFLPTETMNIPKSCIFSSPVYCALCNYSTKVRTNIIRHLKLHEESRGNGGVTEVPSEAPVNPVPCLARKELMFDKMVNLAGSAYVVKANSASVSKEDAEAAPQFVVDQFRYMCSVRNCKQITVDDSMLRAHMKALHSEVDLYHCPHCYEKEITRNDSRNSVAIDRIGFHLKFHGPRLLKCGYCHFLHFQTRIMETHVSQKHFDKKALHSVIRNLDEEGNVSNRRTSVDETQKSGDRWRCALCRALFPSWEEVKLHSENIHKVPGQFMCTKCRYSNDAIFQMTNHINSKECVKDTDKTPSVMIMFARNEGGNTDEAPVHNIWRRDNFRVKHIRGIYLEESEEPVTPAAVTLPPPPKTAVAKLNAVKSTLAANTATSGTKKSINTSSSSNNSTSSLPTCMTCPNCKTFRATTAKDMTIHLHNELRYQRYVCKLCGHKNVTLSSLKVHVENDHKTTYIPETCLILKSKNWRIEKEVARCLSEFSFPPVSPTKRKLPKKSVIVSDVAASDTKGNAAQTKISKPKLSKPRTSQQDSGPQAKWQTANEMNSPDSFPATSYNTSDHLCFNNEEPEVIELSSDDEEECIPAIQYRQHSRLQVARKSTTQAYSRISPQRGQTARKRVTQVPPRYTKSPDREPYSYYRRALSPIDIHSVRVLTEVGEVSTSINVANLKALVDLSPYIPLVDINTSSEGSVDESDFLA